MQLIVSKRIFYNRTYSPIFLHIDNLVLCDKIILEKIMISIAKKLYKKECATDFVSKQDQIELVATMIKNNLKSYAAIHRYKTEINPRLNDMKSDKEIADYISSLDYMNTLYFYSAGLLELTLFEHFLIEKNPEIKEGTRNAEILRAIFNKDSREKGLCANNYIDIADIKCVVLNVFCDLYSSNICTEDDRMKKLLMSYQENFSNMYKGVMSMMDIFTEMLCIDMNSVSKTQHNHGVTKLNILISRAGGNLSKSKIDTEGFAYTLEKLSQIIPDGVVENYKQILIENNDLISLVYNVVDMEYTDESVIDTLTAYLEDKQMSK